jgi:hypothetical protein
MTLDWLRPEPLSACLLGMAAALLGLGGLFLGSARSKRRQSAAITAAILMLGVVAIGTAASGLPQAIWWPLLALAALWGAIRIVRHPLVGRAVASSLAALSGRQASAVLLLVGGGALIALQSVRIEAQWEADADLGSRLEQEWMEWKPDLREVTSANAVTDAGQAIPLLVPTQSQSERTPLKDEKALGNYQNLTMKTIRVNAPCPDYNCHGWVFAAGRFWIGGDWVESILRDNGYQAVPQPGLKDVAIFRDETGRVKHSALVCGFTAEGQPLLEGKWGQLGRYVHTVRDHAYMGTTCTFYHTSRGSHLLQGLQGTEATPPQVGRPLVGG